MDKLRFFILLWCTMIVLAGCAPSAGTVVPTTDDGPRTTGAAAPTALVPTTDDGPRTAGAAAPTMDDGRWTMESAVPDVAVPSTSSPAPLPPSPPAPLPAATFAFGYPIGVAGRVPGDGFFVRHGYTVENTWFNPGYWHTGEDWYVLEGDTAGAEVYAVAAGEVLYVGANYPGRVIIVRHAGDIYSMYGHLDPAVAVSVGQRVEKGARLGTVLLRGDRVPNHLHYEIRTFLTNPVVNGDRPRYNFRCGPNCPPGPGYWPIRAPDLPSDQGWRNPTHIINGRNAAALANAVGTVIVPSAPVSPTLTLWSPPPGNNAPAEARGELTLTPGATFALLAIDAGPEDARILGADAYRLWYQIETDDGRVGWVQAAVANTFERGSDGRAATIRFNLLVK